MGDWIEHAGVQRRLHLRGGSAIEQPPPPPDALVYIDFASPPSSSENGGVYTGNPGSATLDISAVSGTAFTHHSSGGWNNTGYARFYGNNDGSGGIYRGLVPSFAGSPNQLNIRYLTRFNSTYATAQFGNQKGDFFTLGGVNFWAQPSPPSPNLGRKQLQLSYNSTLYIVHGNGLDCGDMGGYNGALCNGSDSGLGAQAAAGPFEYDEWIDEWVCVEHQISSTRYYQYVWTLDRTYNGLYMWSHLGPSGAPGITGISGMYFTEGMPAAVTCDMAQLVIATSFVGPPEGF